MFNATFQVREPFLYSEVTVSPWLYLHSLYWTLGQFYPFSPGTRDFENAPSYCKVVVVPVHLAIVEFHL